MKAKNHCSIVSEVAAKQNHLQSPFLALCFFLHCIIINIPLLINHSLHEVNTNSIVPTYREPFLFGGGGVFMWTDSQQRQADSKFMNPFMKTTLPTTLM